MQKKLIIIGTGLFAEVARSYFEELDNYEVLAFACHEAYKTTDVVYGRPLIAIEALTQCYEPTAVDVFVAIGYGKMNRVRQKVYEEMKELGYRCATFIHPSVRIWSSTTIGENVFIFEDNTIQPFTKIGKNTVLWSGNHVGHHSSIGDNCFISSHVVISGSCSVGNNVFIGVNSTIHDNIIIADECLIGSGTLITKSTAPKEVYVIKGTKAFPKNSDQIGFS
jgi:sugar O-acyltransferase (sialic acid O-acetyltransferase NeuD family)